MLNPTFDSIDEFYRARGGRDAVEFDFGYEWHEGGSRYRISYNPETGDVYAQELAAQTKGDVELLAEGILDVDVVRRALWFDETTDEESLAIRRAHDDESTTLAWARRRVQVGTIAVPPSGDDEPSILGGAS